MAIIEVTGGKITGEQNLETEDEAKVRFSVRNTCSGVSILSCVLSFDIPPEITDKLHFPDGNLLVENLGPGATVEKEVRVATRKGINNQTITPDDYEIKVFVSQIELVGPFPQEAGAVNVKVSPD